MNLSNFIGRIVNKAKRRTRGLRLITKAELALLAELAYSRGSNLGDFPIDFSVDDQSIIRKVKRFTMTSNERVFALLNVLEYLENNNIEGDIVECGVWRGGSMMAAALKLAASGNTSRNLFLFDTFEGMSDPDDRDRQFDGRHAKEFLGKTEIGEKSGAYWCVAGIEDVQQNMCTTGYPESRIHYVKGKVEETLPHAALGTIALLRLDTDWYQSTYHELNCLYDKVAKGGIIIIDDYGHWQGSKKAVDDFLSLRGKRSLLHRIDYSGRLIVKD